MNKRDTTGSSCSPRKRQWKRSFSSSSYDRSSSSDSSSHASPRNSRFTYRASQRCKRSRSPRCTVRSHDYKRCHAYPARPSCGEDCNHCNDPISMIQGVTSPDKTHQDGKNHGSDDDAVASVGCRRTAPNAFALQSILLGTTRSRDRMDERERARAQTKLDHLNSTAKMV